MKKLFLIACLLSAVSLRAAADIDGGKTIFKTRCAACHTIKEKLVGPGLKDIDKRLSEDWIISFVHGSQAMVKKGDAEAVRVFSENGQVVMPDHADLKDDDIKNIIAYIKDESAKIGAANSSNNLLSYPAEVKNNSMPLTGKDYWVFIMFGSLVLIIVLSMFMFIKVRGAMS